MLAIKLLFFVTIGLFVMWQIKFANITYFIDALRYAFGKKNKSDSGSSGVGSITALMSQLAGNLGVGNFAGSALALYYGGPGVIVWFFILSFLCSAIKFGEVVLAHKFRTIDNGIIKGGLFYVIEKGFGAKYKIFAVTSALSVLIIAISSGAMQFNQINSLLFAQNGILNIDIKVFFFTVFIGILVGIIL